MLEGGLSIHTCFLHVLITTGCCGSMLPLTLSGAASIISKETSKALLGNARNMARLENAKLSSTLPSPCCIWPPMFQTSHTHSPQHTHTHSPVQSIHQPCYGHCWFHMSMVHSFNSLPWTNDVGKRKQPTLICHLDRT